jgi:hypothetical protein
VETRQKPIQTGPSPPSQQHTTHAQGTPSQPGYQHKPHTRKAHAGPCQTVDPTQRRLAAPIPETSSREKMCRTSADENLHAETAHRLSSSPHAPKATTLTSNEGKSRRKTSRTRWKKRQLTRSCNNHTITDHRRRCHSNHPHGTLHPPPHPTAGPSSRCTSPRMMPPGGKRH